MRRKIITLIMIVALFIIQVLVLDLLPSGLIRPNLLLILTVCTGFFHGKKAGLWTGIISGLLLDLYIGDLIGFHALLFMYAGYANGHFYKVFFDDNPKIQLLLIGVSDFAYCLIYNIVMLVIRQRMDLRTCFLHDIIPELIFTLAAALVLSRVIYIINKRLLSYELEENESPWLLR